MFNLERGLLPSILLTAAKAKYSPLMKAPYTLIYFMSCCRKCAPSFEIY